ncbi:MAG TPA: hypothetical protein VFN77_05330 [Acetobacteraceae bacterium]|nr:hypothetical protein [Acetobacteraceae bacterium]
MCLLCASSGDRSLARRKHILQLLALVEKPDALDADAALRLAGEILTLAGADGAAFQCEAVLPPPAANTDDGRLS